MLLCEYVTHLSMVGVKNALWNWMCVGALCDKISGGWHYKVRPGSENGELQGTYHVPTYPKFTS